ncbi:transmembrane protein 186 [Genypterus blacodes]|uniref:transmembrane protein 186 n=1 Tax=Genypterus blacodes TaxID=154954 RepID=UPI003F773DE4
MLRSVLLLPRFTSKLLTGTRGSCALTARIPRGSPGPTAAPQSPRRPLPPHLTGQIRYSDLSAQKFTLIYTLPHIRLLSALSRLKLFQTAFTLIILPPVTFFYFYGDVPLSTLGYTTGVALFAAVMLYTASHFFRRVVGMMYLDPSRTVLKVSHLTFWGRRRDVFLPVSDVMTIADAGDSLGEPILKLRRYSGPETFYFSTRFGRVVDIDGFKEVFGILK